jgi:hypothetical protein
MTTYLYAWGNNPVRATLKGRKCKLLATGTRNTVLIEMVDTGERVTTSRRALRRDIDITREGER